MPTERPQWVVREDASLPVLVALYVRQVLGIRSPEVLPHLRGISSEALGRPGAEHPELERQWFSYWQMTVEPQAHPSPVPLDLVDGYDMIVALPTEGFDELRERMLPHGSDAVGFARAAYRRHTQGSGRGVSYRAYAGAIAEFERQVGRRAHSFELNVQVLPFTQRGVWWIGALTVAVTDSLRSDIAGFDKAIGPFIADLA
ncbi:MAG: zinc-binding alcohol dehydrogenase [Microbacterium sp.]